MTRRGVARLFAAIVAALLLLYGLTGKYPAFVEGDERRSVRIEKIFDGDTLQAHINNRLERVRLIGIDTPEIGQKPWGDLSKNHLKKLLSSSSWEVAIEYDIEERDKHGRILAYLRTKDGKLVNEEMLRSGYALLFTFPPNVKYLNEFKSAQSEARKMERGIWGKDGLKQKPYEYRKEHPRI